MVMKIDGNKVNDFLEVIYIFSDLKDSVKFQYCMHKVKLCHLVV
jgi:hypothetical protein